MIKAVTTKSLRGNVEVKNLSLMQGPIQCDYCSERILGIENEFPDTVSCVDCNLVTMHTNCFEKIKRERLAPPSVVRLLEERGFVCRDCQPGPDSDDEDDLIDPGFDAFMRHMMEHHPREMGLVH